MRLVPGVTVGGMVTTDGVASVRIVAPFATGAAPAPPSGPADVPPPVGVVPLGLEIGPLHVHHGRLLADQERLENLVWVRRPLVRGRVGIERGLRVVRWVPVRREIHVAILNVHGVWHKMVGVMRGWGSGHMRRVETILNGTGWC